jgi:fibronectin-binding autotransporter adhesin
VQVFDLAGDLVAMLFRGSRTAGEHLLMWDGRNSAGKIVAPGVYFIKVVGPEIAEVRKVLVTK